MPSIANLALLFAALASTALATPAPLQKAAADLEARAPIEKKIVYDFMFPVRSKRPLPFLADFFKFEKMYQDSCTQVRPYLAPFRST